MSKKRRNKTERVGVNAVEGIVLNDFGWIFREQPIEDMGIDAQIERVDDGEPTGKLIAVQIKTGESHFNETQKAFTYYGELEHLDYWTNHSLPVLLVAHLPDRKETYWVLVNQDTAKRTKKRWKIEIPKQNLFGKKAKKRLEEAFEGTPSQQRMRKLSIDEPLMRHIDEGGKISVEMEEWINKSLSRTPVKVFIIDENGEEVLQRDWFFQYVGYSIEEFVQEVFPWASISVDEEFYEENGDEEDWGNSLRRATDEDNGIFYEDDRPAIYPYTNSCGEVDCYRLELKLNDIGRAFLVVSDYASDI